MEFYCRVLPEGLVPLDEIDWNEKNKLGIGKDVKVHVSIPRNLKFHRKFMALLTIVYDNLPERFTNPEYEDNYIGNLSSLLSAIKMDLGYCELFRVDGKLIYKPKSISFGKMDEAEFERFYDLAVTDILRKYLCGTNRDLLLKEVESFISRP
jgi:hypothetical protein|nr:MAG TPA: Protein of unknown function (DUF1367) [Caudoviricetes sp.]